MTVILKEKKWKNERNISPCKKETQTLKGRKKK